jgi:hypothetical protein
LRVLSVGADHKVELLGGPIDGDAFGCEMDRFDCPAKMNAEGFGTLHHEAV